MDEGGCSWEAEKGAVLDLPGRHGNELDFIRYCHAGSISQVIGGKDVSLQLSRGVGFRGSDFGGRVTGGKEEKKGTISFLQFKLFLLPVQGRGSW